MAFTKQQLREMRENSAAGAARQRAKEQAALDKYMYRRNKEVAKAMSAKERDAAVIKAASDGDTIADIAEKFEMTEARVKKILQKTAGVIDAAELSAEEREQLTAEVEAVAGMAAESEPGKSPQTDIIDVASYIKRTLRKALGDVPETFRVDFRISEGLCELEIADAADSNNTATLTWR